jgi:hypothetical protein
MPPRQRGRRPAATASNQSRAEREIKAQQAKLTAARAAIDSETVALAQLVAEWMEEGVGTTEIGTWLTSDERPKGISRQAVHKLVSQYVDGKKPPAPAKAKENGAVGKPRPRPRPVSDP